MPGKLHCHTSPGAYKPGGLHYHTPPGAYKPDKLHCHTSSGTYKPGGLHRQAPVKRGNAQQTPLPHLARCVQVRCASD